MVRQLSFISPLARTNVSNRNELAKQTTEPAFERGIVVLTISRALREAGYPSLRHVEISIDRTGIVSLRGELPSYYMKQIAQGIVAGLPQVRGLCNEIEVVSHR